MVQIKRAYDPYKPSDGFRILVDRLWPRGISKEKAHLDMWQKDIAPSNELRKWFGHDPKKWNEFQKRYGGELHEKKELVDQLKMIKKKHTVITLVYGAKDTIHNEAVVLAKILQ